MKLPMTIEEIKARFPDEWVLLGDPVMTASQLEVTSGTPLYHSRDKREVCYIGRDKTGPYQTITLIYTGEIKSSRVMTGIFN